jgi:hypothetical protein
MDGLACVLWLALLVLPLAACAATVPLPGCVSRPIEPGDRIGYFLITKWAESEEVVYPWDQDCAKQVHGDPFEWRTPCSACMTPRGPAM